MSSRSWKLRADVPREHVEALARELGLATVTAAALVRRGYGESERARAFLEAALPEHDPFRLGDMEAACETIRSAIAAGERDRGYRGIHEGRSHAPPGARACP